MRLHHRAFALVVVPLIACVSPTGAQEQKPVGGAVGQKRLIADAGLGGLGAARPGAGRRPNRLIREKSPYLHEHAFDPVEWWPWGDAAFAEAKRRDVPLFVSSGYSTCHWCHVMQRESFKDEKVARFLNDNFVCVKIDREELPDVDDDLIRAVTAFQGSAGWPVTIFMGHDRKPFYGGTYFPKEQLTTLAGRILEFWKDPRERRSLTGDALKLEEHLKHEAETAHRSRSTLERSLLASALETFQKNFDRKHKGFGDAPKFPREPDLDFLLRTNDPVAQKMALETLDAILVGGIRDHLGGGFHRYTVDPEWRIPHFEKTLYDQALLGSALALAFELTADARYAKALRETCDYLLRDLRVPSGGFASAEDADSSGEEGRFYTFTAGEVEAALPEDVARYAEKRFGIEPLGKGNLSGRSILWLAKKPEESVPIAGDWKGLEEKARAGLLALRNERVRPRRDDKVLTGWNGLAIGMLARASVLLHEPSFLEAARTAANLVHDRLQAKDGTLLRRLLGGEAKHPAALEDYAYLVRGLVELHQADQDLAWLERALAIDAKAAELFWDADKGAWSSRAKGAPSILPGAAGEDGEGALPSAPGTLAFEERRLAALTGRDDLAKRARAQIDSVSGLLSDQPYSVPTSLAALDRLLSEELEVVIAGPRGGALDGLVAEVRKRRLPHSVLVTFTPEQNERAFALLGDVARGRGPTADGKPQAFVCKGKTCQAPVTEPGELAKLLDAAAK